MSDPAVRRERRALFAFALVSVALVLVGVLAAVVFTAGEPRRGDGMIPPPMGDSAASEDPEDAEAGEQPES